LPASTIGRPDSAKYRAAWAMASSVGSGKYSWLGTSGGRSPSRKGRAGEVLGQLDMGRARLLEGRYPERPADNLGDRIDALDTVFHFITGSNIRTISTTW